MTVAVWTTQNSKVQAKMSFKEEYVIENLG